jgi:hypothetical protein
MILPSLCAGVAQLVEHFLAKEDVASSSLVTRSLSPREKQLPEPIGEIQKNGLYGLYGPKLVEFLFKDGRPLPSESAGAVSRRFCQEANVMVPQDITLARLDTWLAGYENEGRSRQTIRMHAAYVKTFVGWLYKSGDVASNALEPYDLPEEKPRPKRIGCEKPKWQKSWEP